MSPLTVLAVFLFWESIAAKFVRPNRPFFNDDRIPQGQFDQRTPLAELKRMFESLDEIPVSNHVSHDSVEDGPVAWYEPQGDEPLFDKGKCADRFSRCQRFVGNQQCWAEQFGKWMQSKCRKTCGFCKENCWDSKYGCCPDKKTLADGPGKAGCGVKLCIDLRDCASIKKECDSPSSSQEHKAWLRDNCAFTCGFCKAQSPTTDCESSQPMYGCCWNGQEATGWNGQGCLPCEDVYHRACRLFSECNSPFYDTRTFVELNCPKTCGRCGSCIDKLETAKCEKWENKGLCKSTLGWKNYMTENCAKTCGFCESGGNVGVRSFFGL